VRLLIAVLTTATPEAAAKRAAVRASYGAVAAADPRVTVGFFLGQPHERDAERWIQALQVGLPGRPGPASQAQAAEPAVTRRAMAWFRAGSSG
jgi:hypothetical protein